MRIVICSGIHKPQLTQEFIRGLKIVLGDRYAMSMRDILVFPADDATVLSGVHIVQFLRERLENCQPTPLLMIGFSAGVVGAFQAANLWQLGGGTIAALIAVDGWGVPLVGNFPRHRLSHDFFTHWSSSIFDTNDHFYADPAVEHLYLWRSPHTVTGFWVNSTVNTQTLRLTAADFLIMLLERYGGIRD